MVKQEERKTGQAWPELCDHREGPRSGPATPAGLLQPSPPGGRGGSPQEGRREGAGQQGRREERALPPPKQQREQRPMDGARTFLSLCFILTVLCSRDSPSSLAAAVSFSSMVFKRLVFFLSVTSLSFFIKNNLKKK